MKWLILRHSVAVCSYCLGNFHLLIIHYYPSISLPFNTLRLMTSAGWNDILDSLMIQPPDCDISKDSSSNGDCGHPLLSITYFTSFIIISKFSLIAVIGHTL